MEWQKEINDELDMMRQYSIEAVFNPSSIDPKSLMALKEFHNNVGKKIKMHIAKLTYNQFMDKKDEIDFFEDPKKD